ncbi:hypothetical protein MCEMSHM24_02474 [Comamonadaceae bacterium]
MFEAYYSAIVYLVQCAVGGYLIFKMARYGSSR